MKPSLIKVSCRERGYVLLVLLLFVALLSIGMLATVRSFEFQFKRDREEELIHRGVQYSRAIRRFIKVVGRYPTSVEELESTNNIRFLRKRYKDPITGTNFRILHIEDIAYLDMTKSAPGIGGIASQHPQQSPGGIVSNTSAAAGGREPNTDFGAAKSARPEDANFVVGDPADPSASDVPIPPAQTADMTSAAEQAKADDSQSAISASPILGVVSISDAKTIREFHSQNRYNQWLFIYNPATDRGGVLTTPDQPLLNGAAQIGSQSNGQGPGSNSIPSPEQSAASQDPGSGQTNQQ